MEKIRTALIASDEGDGASAIMQAFAMGVIPNIDLRLLVSTKRGAGCLKRAKRYQIDTCRIDRVESKRKGFNNKLKLALKTNEIKLVFLVGCIVKIEPIAGIVFYNIHPVDIEKYSDEGMHGLRLYEEVLSGIQYLITKKEKNFQDIFFTTPTVYNYDKGYGYGEKLLEANVKIPSEIISNFIGNKVSLNESAKKLQEYVSPIGHDMLPGAVNMAARMILNGQ